MFGSSGGFGAAKPATGGFSFGANNTNAAPNTGSGFSFGSASNNANNANPTPFSLGGSTGTNTNTGGFGFGASNNQQQGSTNTASSNLFGPKPATTTPASSGFSFGGAPANNTTSGTSTGVFGNTNAGTNTNQTPNLFGATSNTTNSAAPGGMFGSNNSGTQQTGSMFGNNTASQTPSGQFGGFGNSAGQQTGSLFANQSGNTSQNLFGSQNQQQQGQNPSLFAQQQNGQQSGQQQQQQQPQPQPSIFNSRPAFAWSQPEAQLQGSGVKHPLLVQAQQSASTAASQSNSFTPSINDQLFKIKNSWDPNSPSCLLKTHFYNKVSSNELIANYQRPEDESPEEWEKAMSERPNKYNSVPVRARGFDDLLKRSNIQVEHIKQSRVILNEIHENLTKLSDKHDLDTSVRLAACKTKHKALSRKLLKIAIILSILKSKGYPLTKDEEKLSQQFETLLKSVEDPVGLARSNELWARLSNLRERARNISVQLEHQESTNLSNGVSDTANDFERDNGYDAVVAKFTSVLAKQQQGIQFLYDTIEDDKETLSKLSTKLGI
ncbi:unnamed protein product [Kuraishia capsulata CBS 1993]|uniref:Nucleoporin Nup54 alpha-helical domain-containing protein n=1 Tax=Kuraishia capsulata CBS 1993 TaxID=1382522 RepID=W6MTZ3_9ASCO|nr:uncharacterized protein KUCA_T00001299001 [Kuraishia capsulata CBS 1993]CDK25330.1 unnamed protein product [Kuraishia capsulata CBS 1993]